MSHARRVLDNREMDFMTKLHDEFKEAIDGTDGKVLPEDKLESGSAASRPISNIKSKLSNQLKARLAGLKGKY